MTQSDGKHKAGLPTFTEREQARLKYVENIHGIRGAFWNRVLNQGVGCNLSDLWQACGYGDLEEINPNWYRALYDTFSVANRVCKLMPQETWQQPPTVYEDEDSDTITDFEEAWDNLPKDLASGGQTWHLDEEGSAIWEYLKRLDILSGIGSYGVMLLGIDDGKNLQDPVDGIQVLATNGKPIKETGFVANVRKPHADGSVEMVPTDEQKYLDQDIQNGLYNQDGDQDYRTEEYQRHVLALNKVSGKDSYPNTPKRERNPVGQNPDTYGQQVEQRGQQTTQSFQAIDHPDASGKNPGRNPTSAGSGQAPPNQGYSDGTVGSPGAGPFVQGTDQQYERTSGMGMAFPAGAALSGTDQQYFGVQFGPSEEFGPPTKQRRRLLFLRVFDESLVQVVRYEWNIRNPRFGLPVMYRITLNDPRTPHGGVGLPLATVYVHWSRVIHVADNLHSSEIFGIPRMKPLLEHLLPLRKIYAADGQAYWKNAFNKLVVTTQPTLGGDVDIEGQGPGGSGGVSQLKEDIGLFNDPMTEQALMLIGMDAKVLPPGVTDPTPHTEVHLKAIALQMGIPYPVLQGYEIGEQASENNQEVWNDRKRERQMCQNTKIIVTFVDRLIAVGVLPAPQKQKKEMKEDGKTTKGDPDFVQKPLRPPGSQQPAGPPQQGGGGDKGGYTGPKGDWQGEQAAGAELKEGQQQAPQGPPAQNRRRRLTKRVGRMIYPCNAEGDIEQDTQGKPKAVGVVTDAGYSIEWPEIDALSVKDQAAVCLQQVQADAAFIAGGNDQMVSVRDYLTRYKKFSEEEAEAIIQATTEVVQDQQEQAEQQAEEMGLEPIPPEGFQDPAMAMPPQIAVGPGEKIHHADDLKAGSPLVGQKQVPGAGPQMSIGGMGNGPQESFQDPQAGGKKGFPPGKGKKKGKPTLNELDQSYPSYGVDNALRAHHAIKADLIQAGIELSKHSLCMPGYGSIDIKNDGSGEVWWTGGDSDGEGFDDVVNDRLMGVDGVTAVTYRQEVPPPRVSELLGSGATLWDEVWTNQGSDYRSVYSKLPSMKDLEDTGAMGDKAQGSVENARQIPYIRDEDGRFATAAEATNRAVYASNKTVVGYEQYHSVNDLPATARKEGSQEVHEKVASKHDSLANTHLDRMGIYSSMQREDHKEAARLHREAAWQHSSAASRLSEVAELVKNPGFNLSDRATRLVFADWLEDHAPVFGTKEEQDSYHEAAKHLRVYSS